eukprot:g54186.t1
MARKVVLSPPPPIQYCHPAPEHDFCGQGVKVCPPKRKRQKGCSPSKDKKSQLVVVRGVERESLSGVSQFCRASLLETVDLTMVFELQAGMGGWSRIARPVLCVETGEVYKSITAAARATNASPGNLQKAIEMGWKSKGFTWIYQEQQAAPASEEAPVAQ